jgi:RNA polymerase sigma factor (sigma-70 family)
MSEAVDLERLLAQSDWLRALARRLVGTASADDAVQDTFVAAMQSPPAADLPPRPWLARVLQNVTRMRFRADARRARREDATAMLEPGTATGPDVAVQRLETHRALVDLVLGLDEPYRTTLVRHYFDGDSLAAIARKDGVPEGTVRWRHKKALEYLRARLDDHAGGDRRAWLAALAPVAAPPLPAGTTLMIGGLVMKSVMIGVVTAVIGGVAVWRLPVRSATTDAHAAGAAGGTVALPGTHTAASPTSTPAPPQHVTRLATAAERQRVADQIASARRTKNHGPGATPAPRLPDAPGERLADGLDRTTMKAAMQEVLPFLARCYEAALPTLASDRLELQAQLTLDGDRDAGTIIDAQQLFDDANQPLPAALDDCLRSTFQTLQLPPLAEGDHVEVTYPFLFSS